MMPVAYCCPDARAVPQGTRCRQQPAVPVGYTDDSPAAAQLRRTTTPATPVLKRIDSEHRDVTRTLALIHGNLTAYCLQPFVSR